MSVVFRARGSAEQALAPAVSLRALVLLVMLALSLIGLSVWSEGIIRHEPAPAGSWIDPTVVSPWIPAGGEDSYVP